MKLALTFCLLVVANGQQFQCNMQDGVVIGAKQKYTSRAKDAKDCCAQCFGYAGCVAYTFDTQSKKCVLKDNVRGKTPMANQISGTFTPSRTISTRACLPPHDVYPFCNTSLPIDERVNDLVKRLELEDKLPMLTARESPLGAVDRLGVPEYNWGANCVHGVQSRCGEKCPTSFPNPNAQGAAWNRSLWRDMAHVTGKELRALWLADIGENRDGNLPHLGLDCWSPNININRDPRWGRNLETPGESPFLNGQYGAWHTMGLQEGEDKRFLQAVVTLKHWAAYSLEDDGGGPGKPGRHNFNAVINDFDLADTYFPAFKTAIKQGKAKGVMCSYNAVNGVPSCASKFLLQTVLRDTWGYDGYVTSDSGAVEDIYRNHHYLNSSAAEGVAFAVKAGCDIDSSLDKGHSRTGSPYTWSIQAAIDQKLLLESELDPLLHRSLKMRFELGLFDPIADQPYWNYTVNETVDTPSHQELNLLATRQGMVLLQNNNSALPLYRGKKIALIGPHVNAQKSLTGNYLGQICPGGGFSCVEKVSDAVKSANNGGPVNVVEGCDVAGNSTEGIPDAVAAAKDADTVVLVVGLDTEHVEREGHDRTSIGLPGVQEQLVKAVVAAAANKPVVMLVINGGAVALDWSKNHVDAIVEAFYPGPLGSKVMAEVLFGDTNPGGKLPYTVYPANYVDESDFTDYSMTNKPGRGYRYYTGTPLWPFGHGLSYTTFELNLKAPGDTLPGDFTVDVHNTGSRDGDEVIQMYFVPKDISLVHRGPLPLRELIGFQRVSVPAGQEQSVSFHVLPTDLAVTDALGNRVLAPGSYELWFGNGNGEWKTHAVTVGGEEKVLAPFPK